ncbi:MAG: hypothetical protein ACI9X4_002134, partial [Glaciecola sp.]
AWQNWLCGNESLSQRRPHLVASGSIAKPHGFATASPP